MQEVTLNSTRDAAPRRRPGRGQRDEADPRAERGGDTCSSGSAVCGRTMTDPISLQDEWRGTTRLAREPVATPDHRRGRPSPAARPSRT